MITIQFDVFDISFIFFIPMFKTITVINRSGTCSFYTHHTSGEYAGVCACDRTHQIKNTTVPEFR